MSEHEQQDEMFDDDFMEERRRAAGESRADARRRLDDFAEFMQSDLAYIRFRSMPRNLADLDSMLVSLREGREQGRPGGGQDAETFDEPDRSSESDSLG